MDHTMLTTRDYTSNQVISLDKSGNQYYLWFNEDFTNIDSKADTRIFDNLEEAKTKYCEIVKCMILGDFSYKDRCKILHK